MVPDPQAGVIDRRRHHVTSKHQGICPTIPEVNTETISLGFAASYARLVADHVSALVNAVHSHSKRLRAGH
mgnify:CR=1 FL=1